MTPPDVSLLFVMVCFWLTMWLVYRYLIAPVGRVLADRQSRIDEAQRGIDDARADSRQATERLERQMEEIARDAGRIRAGHRDQALADRQSALEEARSRADATLQEALHELEGAAAEARHDLRERAHQLARSFASQLLGREVRT